MSRSQHRKTNSPRDHPGSGRRFYAIDQRKDGTADVYLIPYVREYETEVRVVRGVVPWDGMEEDIRERFYAWCESGEMILNEEDLR